MFYLILSPLPPLNLTCCSLSFNTLVVSFWIFEWHHALVVSCHICPLCSSLLVSCCCSTSVFSLSLPVPYSSARSSQPFFHKSSLPLGSSHFHHCLWFFSGYISHVVCITWSSILCCFILLVHFISPLFSLMHTIVTSSYSLSGSCCASSFPAFWLAHSCWWSRHYSAFILDLLRLT